MPIKNLLNASLHDKRWHVGISSLLFFLMTFMFVWDRSYNLFAALLLLLSLVVVALRIGNSLAWDREIRWLMSILVAGVAIGLMHVLLGGESFTVVERPLKLLFILPIMLAIVRVGVQIKLLQFGLVLGVVITALIVGYQHHIGGMLRAANGYNPLPFSEVALTICGVLSAFCLVDRGWRSWMFGVGAIAAFYCVIVSGSRGTLLAVIPMLLTLILIAWFRRQSCWWRLRQSTLAGLVVVLVLTSLGGSIVWKSSGIGERISQAFSSITTYKEDPSSISSVGIRLNLWQSAWISFQENPIVGVGHASRPQYLRDLNADGRVSLGDIYWAHTHSDYFDSLQRYGLPSMLLVIALYVALFKIFLSVLRRSAIGEQFSLALGGLLSVVGYATFSLTEVPLRNGLTLVFFVVLMAVLVGMLKRRELGFD